MTSYYDFKLFEKGSLFKIFLPFINENPSNHEKADSIHKSIKKKYKIQEAYNQERTNRKERNRT